MSNQEPQITARADMRKQISEVSDKMKGKS
jgi:hypothetical protein